MSRKDSDGTDGCACLLMPVLVCAVAAVCWRILKWGFS